MEDSNLWMFERLLIFFFFFFSLNEISYLAGFFKLLDKDYYIECGFTTELLPRTGENCICILLLI